MFYPTMEPFESQWDQGAPQTEASPLMQRRQRSVEVLMPVIGRVGVQVCSTLTDGAGPERVAHGQVVAVHDDRIQVRVDTQAVLQHSDCSSTHVGIWSPPGACVPAMSRGFYE